MLVPPPIVALAAGLGQRALAGRPQRPGFVRAGVAVAVVAGSVASAVTAARGFRREGTTLSPERPGDASVLVTTGAHAVSRNPMYLGLTGVLVANAIRLRSWTALLPLAAFVAFVDRVQIPSEEAALLDHFGAEYDAYRARVPRWLDQRSVDAAREALAAVRRPTPGAGSVGR